MYNNNYNSTDKVIEIVNHIPFKRIKDELHIWKDLRGTDNNKYLYLNNGIVISTEPIIDRCISSKKNNVLHKVLDVFDVPTDLSLEERITYYRLFINGG